MRQCNALVQAFDEAGVLRLQQDRDDHPVLRGEP
jgi:hypothetical protein